MTQTFAWPTHGLHLYLLFVRGAVDYMDAGSSHQIVYYTSLGAPRPGMWDVLLDLVLEAARVVNGWARKDDDMAEAILEPRHHLSHIAFKLLKRHVLLDRRDLRNVPSAGTARHTPAI